jgi:asparaginyl-tRNA synthetase
MSLLPFLQRATVWRLLQHCRSSVGDGVRVSVSGRVVHARRQKAWTFVELNDGTSPRNLHVVMASSALADQKLAYGAAISVSGTLQAAPARATQAVELQCERVDVLGACDGDAYPLQEKEQSAEFLRSVAHLRARTARSGSVLRVRGAALQAVHGFFAEHRFVNVHTPILTANDCEGGGEQFQLDGAAAAFFAHGAAPSLTVSGQLEAEAAATALGRVYTFGPTFRADRSTGGRHLAEFWMVEPEMVDCGLPDAMDVAEQLVKHVVAALLARHADDLLLAAANDGAWLAALQRTCAAPWRRITYAEALREVEHDGALSRADEQALTTRGVTFVHSWPLDQRPFYARVDDATATAQCFDLYVPRVGELVGGSVREDRLARLEQTMAERRMNRAPLEWYVDLRRFGSVPHAGFGLGFERLVQWICNVDNIRDVTLAPRHSEGKLTF